MLSAGGVCQAADLVARGEADNAFAVVRPPGHHAGARPLSHGFCFFNNVAAAAVRLKRQHSAKKILIFDWDVHHCDGTEKIFYEDHSVLVLSMHRHDAGTFFPQSGAAEHTGEGFNLNIPFNLEL